MISVDFDKENKLEVAFDKATQAIFSLRSHKKMTKIKHNDLSKLDWTSSWEATEVSSVVFFQRTYLIDKTSSSFSKNPQHDELEIHVVDDDKEQKNYFKQLTLTLS